MDSATAVADVLAVLHGEPVFLAGSLCAAEAYGKPDAYSDVDLFCPTDQVIMTVGQKLIDSGYTLPDRFDRVWARWKKFGFKKWHTNSLRLVSPGGVETNLVYKLTDGHPTTSLAQVLESFDFGLLHVGYEVETGARRCIGSYMFPGEDLMGPLPLMPNKRSSWRSGFISQYNGIREVQRVIKYVDYGYDMSRVLDDLTTGYEQASYYFEDHFDPEKQTLGKIYQTIGVKLAAQDWDDLRQFSKQVDYKDSLDMILEGLE